MRDWIKIFGLGTIVCLVLALLCILVVVVAPSIFGVSAGGKAALAAGQEPASVQQAKINLISSLANLLPVVALLFIMLGGLCFVIAELVALYEMATAKNDTGWKVLWALIVIILGMLGLALYLFVARKERK